MNLPSAQTRAGPPWASGREPNRINQSIQPAPEEARVNANYISPNPSLLVAFAPGDQVIRYVDGQAYTCMVIEVPADGTVRVQCHLWPNGYSAVVKAHEVVLLSRHCQGLSMF